MRKTIFLLSVILIGYSIAFALDITSTRAIEEYFKEHTKLRIAADAVETYKTTLNGLTTAIIKRAEELAHAAKRKTVLKRDVEQASEEILRQAPMDVKELMSKIKQLSIIELADLTNQVKKYSEELLEQKE